MNENKRQKLSDMFDALLKAGLNPESFAKNESFVDASTLLELIKESGEFAAYGKKVKAV